jgi:hypothetical protein
VTPPVYAITVTQPETGGSFTVTAGNGVAVTEAEAGTIITLTAAPTEGYEFTEWTVTGVTLTDDTANSATFIMPTGTVTVTAVFDEEEVSVTTYTVTFNAMGGSDGPSPVTVEVGNQVAAPNVTGMTSSNPTIAATVPFGGWFTDTTLRTPVEFPITVNEDIEVYAKWDNKYILVAREKTTSWQLAGQVVELTGGITYKLGAEYKVGRIAADGSYAQLILSVQWVSGGALQSPAAFYKFDGTNTAWVRAEVDFTPQTTGWYRIGIEDSSRNYTVNTGVINPGYRKAYANRVWLYPADATSASENKLVDADFAANHLPMADDRSGERFLDITTGGPFYTNNTDRIPAWVEGDWVAQCFKWWGTTGGDVFLDLNPTIENY